ncbi:hypothetical protein F1737_03325 [Methanoplanus sp. FWC-SCC4]|uniref:DUF5611 domain-containing protein n=2 Tax=Methanochimaera problematica TaxID=2609417 RepID=A0AA97FBE4_9EURY|nr:hypothetical protein F1737_03325 [Methanoplanus sp. FWC-SCC4]
MQEYQIKRGFKTGLMQRMTDGLEKYFEEKPEEKNGHYIISFGSFKNLDASLNEKGNLLIIDTESDSEIYDKYPEDEADKIVMDTNSRYRKYLEYVTGYNTKERKKKAADKVKNNK